MHKRLQVNGLRLLVAALFGLFAVVSLHAQCPATMPAGTVCILQATANQAAEDHRVRAAVEAENVTLKDSLKAKDATIAENKDAAQKNVADLTDRLHKTEVELARNVGMITQCQANLNNDQLVITALVQNTKARNRIGLINF